MTRVIWFDPPGLWATHAGGEPQPPPCDADVRQMSILLGEAERDRDAALSRTEAAERSNMEGRREHTEQFEARWAAEFQWAHEKRLRLDAESRLAEVERELKELREFAGPLYNGETDAQKRLAEATGLLNSWRFHDRKQCQAKLCWETDAFVGSTPAPAAEPERCHVCGRTGGIDHGTEYMGHVEFPESICEECYRKRAQAAEPAADTPADLAIADCRAALDSMLHPDTIALGQCRAELEAWRAAHGPFGPQTPAEVAIFAQEGRRVDAEIAAHSNAQLESARADLATARTRIAQAVAELTGAQYLTGGAVERALAILKGTRT